MRCARCNRELQASAVPSIDTRGQPLSVGPTCARKMGLTKSRHPRVIIITPGRRQVVDEAQMELPL